MLTAALAVHSGWDTTGALSLNLAESGGALTGTSFASAQQGATLSLVDFELIAYESATLTGARQYKLTGLQRGMYGSAAAAHSSGASFVRLDSAIVKYALPSSYIGKPVYLKFQSFNVFGAGVQALSTCVAYLYTPTGAGALGPVAAALAVGTPLDFGLVAATVAETDDWGDATSPYVTSINLGNLTS